MPAFDDHNHHHHRHENGWRRFERFTRRLRDFPGFQGFPSLDGLEGNFRIGRMLASGDLRLVSLFLIEQQPRHGYDLIKAIEDKTGGFYSPSPGIVYPALTFLEEAGFVTSSTDGNKKHYAITAEGREHLAENRAAVESTLDYLGKIGRRWAEMRDRFSEAASGQDAGPRAPDGPPHSPPPHPHRADRDIPDVLPEVNDARRALKAAIAGAVGGDERTQHRLAEILNKAARKIQSLESDGDIDL